MLTLIIMRRLISGDMLLQNYESFEAGSFTKLVFQMGNIGHGLVIDISHYVNWIASYQCITN